jgi:Mg2+-importing ATPase
MLTFGPLSSLFDVLTFAVLGAVGGLDTPAEQAAFQGGWFTVGLISQCLVVLLLRTMYRWRRPAPQVVVAAVGGGLLALAIPYTALATALHMRPVPAPVLPWLLVVVTGYLVSVYLAQRMSLRAQGRPRPRRGPAC